MLELGRLPRTLTVIGAGVIGVEYATIFSALDVPVTLVEPRNTILDFVDREIVDDFIHQMRDRGMTIRLGSTVKEIASKPDYAEVTLADGRTIRSEIVLYAAGRSGNLGSLGLDVVGIEADSEAASRSIRKPSRPVRRTSTPPATSSVSRAWLRPRWSRAGSPPAMPSA